MNVFLLKSAISSAVKPPDVLENALPETLDNITCIIIPFYLCFFHFSAWYIINFQFNVQRADETS